MSILEKINHQLAGPEGAPKLVFLHGLLGSAANWRRVVSAFSEDFRVLTLDQRGHGRSFQPQEGYEPEDFANDLAELLDALGWTDEILLVGHSMGGRNSVAFASMFSHRTKLLVVEDIGPEINEKAAAQTRRLVEMVPVPFESKKAAREYFNTRFLEENAANPQAKVLSQYFYTNILETPTGQADWRFYKDGILKALDSGHAKDRWSQWGSLTMPTLFMRGEHSKELLPEVFERLVALAPHYKGVEIKDSGHWVHFDQVDEFIKEIKNFFSDHGF